jgi:ABC-type phosphate transport system substrate-binding protein
MLLSKGNIRMKFVAGAVMLCLASAAGATSLVGGGATLPAIGYTGKPSFPDPASPSPIITMGAGSLFGVLLSGTSNTVSYCPTGSGNGKKILAGNDPSNFQVNAGCGTITAPTATGFGGVGLAQADFAASDAPMSVSEFNNYVLGHGTASKAVQLPAISGAIAIAFRKDAQGSVPAVSSLTLTEAQICGIFSGQIKTWNDTALTGAGIPTGTTGNINVVFRSDNSGTSFSLLNHLSAVCPTNVASGKTAATNFKTDQSFPAVGALSYVGTYASSTPASGNKGVTDAIAANDGSIGYAEAANPISAPTRFASVKNSHAATTAAGINPSTGFGNTALPVTLQYDQALATTLSSTGRPSLTPLSTTGQCVAIVNPNDYADPSTGYPILAVTYLLANGAGNGANQAAIQGLMYSPYNLTSRPSVTKIGRITTGYSWLSNADLTAPAIQTKINGCVGT